MRKLSAVVSVGLFATVISGCGKKKEADPAAAASGAASASGTAAGTAAGTAGGTGDAPLPPVIAVDDAAVKKLIETWLAAQNNGDFAAYSALYADKLEGIKRVGARTWRFDRDGWLTDRQRMFKHPMTVGAKDVVVRGGAIAATVNLVQTFSQGKFKDEGPKHLVLIRTDAGFQIAREEMLRSDIGGAAANGKASAYVVITVDKKPYVVITPEADPAWGSGLPRGPFQEFHQLALVDAPAAPMASAWTARALKVFAADGTACDATVGKLALVAGGTPHFGEVQEWDGDPAMSDDGRKWSPGERARAIYAMATPSLIGELAVTGACAPVVAVDPAAKAVGFGKQPADAAADAKALAAFRALPDHKTLQADWAANYDGKGPWESSATVTRYAAGGRTFAVVSAAEGSGCGDFLGELVAIFEDQGGKLALISDPAQGFMRVDAIVDSDGDGKIELVGAMSDYRMMAGHFVPASTGFTAAVEVSFPNNDCGC